MPRIKLSACVGPSECQAIPASGRRRPSRDRQATPDVLVPAMTLLLHDQEGDVPPNDALTVQFSGAVSTEASHSPSQDVHASTGFGERT